MLSEESLAVHPQGDTVAVVHTNHKMRVLLQVGDIEGIAVHVIALDGALSARIHQNPVFVHLEVASPPLTGFPSGEVVRGRTAGHKIGDYE